jgi:peptide/nickel transport system ATP-binding protein
MTAEMLIEGRGLSKRFARRPDVAARMAGMLGGATGVDTVHAVDRVDIAIARNEVVGLVGESGCGKSTLGRLLAWLLEPSEGEVLFAGRPLGKLSPVELKAARLAVQMIFQDPHASLNPRMRAEDIIGEAPQAHGLVSRRETLSYVEDLLARVGLSPRHRRRYPHQFSGGQRQRLSIARALAVKPRFLVCDEAIAALDVSIQAQIINLFMDLRAALDLTILFISHDLGVVEHICDRVIIMYLGRVVEEAPTSELFKSQNHPYSRALLAGVPRLDQRKRSFAPLEGEIPSPLAPPPGCHFHPRCPFAFDRCRSERPALKEIGPGRMSACHLND